MSTVNVPASNILVAQHAPILCCCVSAICAYHKHVIGRSECNHALRHRVDNMHACMQQVRYAVCSVQGAHMQVLHRRCQGHCTPY
jgi:hypothetical protein